MGSTLKLYMRAFRRSRYSKWAQMCEAFGAESERLGIDVETLINMCLSVSRDPPFILSFNALMG